jgi:dihydrofolate reductase
LRGAGMFVYGRRVYKMMAAYWPTADEDPGSNRFQVEYSKIWKMMPKLVFSRTLGAADWNTTVVRDIDERVKQYADTATFICLEVPRWCPPSRTST